MKTDFSSAIEAVENGEKIGPVTRSLAKWDHIITEEAVRRVNELRLKDLLGDRGDGQGRFRGSLLGSCDRMQLLSYLGFRGVEKKQGPDSVMRDGTYRHYFWQEVGLSAGFLSDIEVPAAHDPWKFRGQMDGQMAFDPLLPGKGGFELKTTNQSTYNSVVKREKKPPLKTLKQIGGYCESLGLDWFSVIYEVRHYTIEWHEFVIHYDDELRSLTESSVNRLLHYKEQKKLAPIKEKYPSDNECASWCSFKKLCPQVSDEVAYQHLEVDA